MSKRYVKKNDTMEKLLFGTEEEKLEAKMRLDAMQEEELIKRMRQNAEVRRRRIEMREKAVEETEKPINNIKKTLFWDKVRKIIEVIKE